MLVWLLLSVWFALCWCWKKVLHYVAIDRWLAYVKNKLSAVYEWIKKRRERRKVSAEGQTYDLPKNGNCYLIFFLHCSFNRHPRIRTRKIFILHGSNIYGQCNIFRRKFSLTAGRAHGYLHFFLNQFQKHLSTFARKYYVAWEYVVILTSYCVSEDAKWAESKFYCMKKCWLHVCFALKSGDAAVLHMLQNKDNDPYRFVCHSIKVIKSWTKQIKITFTNLHWYFMVKHKNVLWHKIYIYSQASTKKKKTSKTVKRLWFSILLARECFYSLALLYFKLNALIYIYTYIYLVHLVILGNLQTNYM